MRVLHLIRALDDSVASAVVAAQANGQRVTVVFLHDAVYRPPVPGTETLYLEEDCQARGISPNGPQIDYDELLSRILESDRVVSW